MQTKNDPKRALRATLLASREAHNEHPARAALNEVLAARLAEVIDRYEVSCVGFYWPVAGEFDARAVLTQWLAADASRSAALPIVVQPHAPMVFHAWHAQSAMKTGRYRIPVPEDETVVVPELLLIPCVGFDADRFRLGYGGGYYDRTLAAWPDAKKPVTIGIAFEAGKCDALPREAHDVPLDGIVTEEKTY
ncbi:5-formyltetrahydrofolate cyclo-ligase [Candidatus Burkholderia verschuerenii]|uniref:5-formyltetrahydrofolate cyclo-ligase n=1 Tax=Candidatus Burkholderia verschuerenii TaxID=242163 RepID=A0A0L0M8V7_9BURK|nr:5-formyltetrahydrofolate cyclo-ligase [Candidatus Burkholderia verschuerenii]KND59082.1 5-formyltetrahydrofolate cyclo-ligase [Candidatus Burkholderia verschuerenii]